MTNNPDDLLDEAEYLLDYIAIFLSRYLNNEPNLSLYTAQLERSHAMELINRAKDLRLEQLDPEFMKRVNKLKSS